jgi:hypothetical protein
VKEIEEAKYGEKECKKNGRCSTLATRISVRRWFGVNSPSFFFGILGKKASERERVKGVRE